MVGFVLMARFTSHDLRFLVLSVTMMMSLVACTITPTKHKWKTSAKTKTSLMLSKIQIKGDRREVVLYALGLLGVNYQFGGTNPEAGVDCSGMVGFIYKNALGVQLPRTAADIAKIAHPIARHRLQAGDFVFFNTMNRRHSHIGIYLGDNKFIHAPSSKSHVKVESLDMPYFASRFERAGTIFK